MPAVGKSGYSLKGSPRRQAISALRTSTGCVGSYFCVIPRQSPRRHTKGHGDLGGEDPRLPVASVVGVHVLVILGL
jgi:hypothetical protein